MSLYRERFALTFAHKPVDRCPIDLGGTPQSTIEGPTGQQALAEYLGFTGPAPADYLTFDRRILEHFDIDFRRCGGLFAFETGRAHHILATEQVDGWGIKFRFSGQFWDIIEGPLQHADKDAVAKFEFPTLDQAVPRDWLEKWTALARYLYEETPWVVVGEHPVFGVLELACWLAGYDWVMLQMADDPEWVHLFFERIYQFQRPLIEAYYSAIGRYIHLTTSGDDFGTQKASFCSPAMFREYVMPYLKRRIACTKRFTDAFFMHHSCGAVFDLVPSLLEAGVEALNPIQPVVGMAPDRLKTTYGDQLVFHGGLDTQEVLPSGNEAHIRQAVAELLAAMKPTESGGFIFAPAHNLQSDVSPASIAWMYEAAKEVYS